VILTLLGDRRNASLTTPKVLRGLQYHNNLLTRFKRASRPFSNGHNAPDLGYTVLETAKSGKRRTLEARSVQTTIHGNRQQVS
jgi:hypothetical protein